MDYYVTVKYKKGSSNLIADSLSRNPGDDILNEDMLEVNLSIQEVKEEDFEWL